MNVTPAELEAHRLLLRAGEVPHVAGLADFHGSANRIIALAEQIKAERAVAAMEPIALHHEGTSHQE